MKKLIPLLLVLATVVSQELTAQTPVGQYRGVEINKGLLEKAKENQNSVIEPGTLLKPKLSVGQGKSKIEFRVEPTRSDQVKFNSKLLKRKTETIDENCLNNFYESSGKIESWKVFDAEGNSAVADVVPGAVYDISYLDGSFFTPVENYDRQPIRISLTKSVQSSVTQSKVKNPKAVENIRDKGVKPIQLGLKKKVFAPRTKIKTDFARQYTSRDLEVALGGTIPYVIGKADFKNKYTSQSSNDSYTYLLELEESFYTLKATGNAISNKTIFTETPDNDHQLAYVERVVYGRKIVVIVTSETDLQSMSNSFSVKSSGSVNAEVDVNGSSSEKAKNISYEIFLMGGSSNYNIPIGTNQGTFNELLEELGNIISKGNSNAKDAVPISFVMKDLNNKTLVSTYSPYETKVKSCQPKFKVTLQSLEVKSEKDGAADKKLELYGSFKVDAFTAVTNRKEIYDTEATSILNNPTANVLTKSKSAASSGLTTFATKDAPLKRGKNRPKTFNPDSKESGGDLFALTNSVEDDGYFKIIVNAFDKDKMSGNDELDGNSGKVSFHDINGSKRVVVTAAGKAGRVEFVFLIEKVN